MLDALAGSTRNQCNPAMEGGENWKMARLTIPGYGMTWGVGHGARVGEGSREALDYGKNRAKAFFEAQSTENNAEYIPTTPEAGKPLRSENKADSDGSNGTSRPRFDRISPPQCPPKRKTGRHEWVDFAWQENLNNAEVSREEAENFFPVGRANVRRWQRENRIPEYYLEAFQNWLEWHRKVRKTRNR